VRFSIFGLNGSTLVTMSFSAAVTIYFALRGNRMILEQIKQENFEPEAEKRERVIASARQQKQLRFGFWLLGFLLFVTFVVPLLFLSAQPNFFDVFSPLITTAVPYAAVIAFVLLLAPKYRSPEDELCKKKVSEEMIRTVSFRPKVYRNDVKN